MNVNMSYSHKQYTLPAAIKQLLPRIKAHLLTHGFDVEEDKAYESSLRIYLHEVDKCGPRAGQLRLHFSIHHILTHATVEGNATDFAHKGRNVLTELLPFPQIGITTPAMW